MQEIIKSIEFKPFYIKMINKGRGCWEWKTSYDKKDGYALHKAFYRFANEDNFEHEMDWFEMMRNAYNEPNFSKRELMKLENIISHNNQYKKSYYIYRKTKSIRIKKKMFNYLSKLLKK